MSRPIEELWSGSCNALQEIEVPAGISLGDPYRDITNVIIISALVIYLLFAHRRIVKGLSIVLQGIFSHKKLMGIEAQSNLQVCRNTLFSFLTICTSFVFANIAYATKTIGYEYTLPVRFAGILGAFVIYFALKHISIRFLAWLNKKNAIKLVLKILITHFMKFKLLMLSPSLYNNLFLLVLFKTI